jgi:hypothetical protein
MKILIIALDKYPTRSQIVQSKELDNKWGAA